MDNNGRTDAYVQIRVGVRRVVNDKKNYVPANLNPTFGRVFEFEVQLPLDSEMVVSVWDYDTFSGDDLVGETRIDLENRLLAKCRAHCGLPLTYAADGVFGWRDNQTPTEILARLCMRFHLPAPEYSPDGDRPARVTVRLPNFPTRTYHSPSKLPADMEMAHLRENAALAALHAARLVPEHVETRGLIAPLQPELEQGKIELFVDVFRKEDGSIPPAVDITPRKPQEYELRIVIWNTYDVVLDEKNIAGEEMSDIYVRAFMRGMEGKKQKTDTHYRSLNGEGNFNWRLVYRFMYVRATGATAQVLVCPRPWPVTAAIECTPSVCWVPLKHRGYNANID